MITDLIYDDAAFSQIKEKFPDATSADAQDIIHTARIEVLEKENALLRKEAERIVNVIIYTVGGTDDEGHPTSPINYLQRLRSVVADSRRVDWLCDNATYAIHSEIEASKGEGVVRWRRGHDTPIDVRKVLDSAALKQKGGE